MTRLSDRSRVLVTVAALLILAVFFVPLWRIQLQAPQYPEGLGMLIRVNTITGLAPTDLDNINELNHYIGMKAIVPEAIPVLRYMPWAAGVIALLGFATALAGRRALLGAWIGTFAIGGGAGLAEFYAWSYDYGHNLAADAIIKVPGMSYQPPLIGSSQLLNFTASSWPAAGGWLAAAAFMLAIVALLLPKRRAPGATMPALKTLHVATTFVATLVLLAMGCRGTDPTPIAYDRADCDVCRMRISDSRFGGELVTTKGKVHQFDSIECLANYAVTVATQRDVRSMWVSDFDHPGHLLEVSHARFSRRGGSSSPMGAGFLAVSSSNDIGLLAKRFGGASMTWDDIRSLATRGALRVNPSARGAGHAS